MNFQLLNVLILVIVSITPLIRATGHFGYEQVKILFFIVSITLMGFLWLFSQPKVRWNLIKIVSFVFILILLTTSVLGIDPKVSLIGTHPYFQGVLVYAYLFIFSLIVSTTKIKLDHYAIVLTSSALIVAALAIQDWVLINMLGQPIPTYAGRVVSTFGQPNFYAGFLLLTLPFSYFLLKSLDQKLQFLGWGGGIVSLSGIVVSYSRAAILLALVLLILALIDQLKIKRFMVTFFAVLAIAVAVFLSINSSSGFVWKEFLQPVITQNPDLTKVSVENRVYIWPVAWQLVLQKPLLGYGLENINQAFSNYFQTNYYSLFEANSKVQPVLISLKELNIDRSHNYILDLLLFSGILGFLSWLFLIAIILRKLIFSKINPETTTMLIGLSLYLIWIQFQNQSIVHLLYFWLLVGMINQVNNRQSPH